MEIETIFDDDAQKLANWLASNPKQNSDIFLKICKSISDKNLPVTYKLLSHSDDMYFYTEDEKIEHCLCIVRPSSSCGEPEELLEEWSDPDNFDLPTIFAKHSFIERLRQLDMFDIQSMLRNYKIEEIVN